MRDDFDSVIADRCRAVDDVAVPEDLWSRVQLKVLDSIPVQFREEETTIIDFEIPGDVDEHHTRWKRALVVALLAAAALIMIAVVATRRNDSASPADQPSRTVTAVPTAPPRPLFGTPGDDTPGPHPALAPGTYYVDEFDGTATPRVFVTIDDGWFVIINDWEITSPPLGGMSFSRPDRVFIDACDASAGFAPAPAVTTLDGLTAALTQQRGWAEITTPRDITVNGYPGKEFQRTAPADTSGCNGPPDGGLLSWESGPLGAPKSQLEWRYYTAGQIETLRVLDINGTIVIINTRHPMWGIAKDNPDSVAKLAAVLDSIRIEQA